jgi:predicted membrane protein
MIKFFKYSSHLFSVFVIIGVISIFLKEFVKRNHINIDVVVLQGANAILYILSLITLNLQIKAMNNTNPNVFIRSVMGSMMIKMFIVVAIVFAYTILSGDHFNKRGIFISLFFYLIYLAVEVFSLMKLNKQKNA